MLDLRCAFQFSYERPQAGDELCGDWTREQLLAMNDRFVAAVEAAFHAGNESPVAASATVKVRKRRLTEEEAIEAAWKFLWQEEGDLPFAVVVAFARTQCPNVTAADVRAGFEKRFARRSTPTSSA